MPFEVRLEQSHIIDFNAKAMLAAQQSESRLRKLCYTVAGQGEQSRAVEVYGRVTATRQTERLPSNPDNVANRFSRWIKFEPTILSGEYITDESKWKSLFDPTSQLLQVHTAAVQREIDTVILRAAMGPAIEGTAGSQSNILLGAAQTVDVGAGGANSNLNLDKLIAARRLLGLAEVDPMANQRMTAVMTWHQMGALLNIPNLTSRDFTNEVALEAGRMSQKVGIDFLILSTDIWGADQTNTTFWKQANVRYIPVIAPGALTLCVWKDLSTKLTNDSHRLDTLNAAVMANMNATRNQETHVVRIECNEA